MFHHAPATRITMSQDQRATQGKGQSGKVIAVLSFFTLLTRPSHQEALTMPPAEVVKLGGVPLGLISLVTLTLQNSALTIVLHYVSD